MISNNDLFLLDRKYTTDFPRSLQEKNSIFIRFLDFARNDKKKQSKASPGPHDSNYLFNDFISHNKIYEVSTFRLLTAFIGNII